MTDERSIMMEKLFEEIHLLRQAITKLDDRVRDEIARNNERYTEMSLNHASMRGDIRLVSAKVAAVVSAIGIAIAAFLRKMGF